MVFQRDGLRRALGCQPLLGSKSRTIFEGGQAFPVMGQIGLDCTALVRQVRQKTKPPVDAVG